MLPEYQILQLIERESHLFASDLKSHESAVSDIVKDSSFLVIGGAGSIGQAVSTEIFKRDPKTLHVVDVSENNLVELVRNLRSTDGYGSGDFRTFSIDCGSTDYESFFNTEGPYDYVLNLSALKHVRSEKIRIL